MRFPRLAFFPTQNHRYRHRMVIEFETSNRSLDDFGRALEPYTPAEARRFALREIQQNAGISDQPGFRVVEHGVKFLPTARRRLVAIVRRALCNDCERKRVCFRYKLRGHSDRWACVEECASMAWDRGWRPRLEKAE